MNKIKYITLSFFATTFLLTACAPTPTSTNPSGNNTNTSNQTGLSAEATAAFSSMYENEGIFQDSEAVASQKSEFNTKGLLDGSVGIDLNTDLKGKIDSIAAQLSNSVEISAELAASIGRTDFSVKSSNVVNTNNADGSNTKTVSIDFTSKANSQTKNDKVAKTFMADGSTKIEHYLTVNFTNYGKIATRTVIMNGGQKTVETKSSAKLSNGVTIDINESRNSSNGSQGAGTIVIKSVSGATTNYSFNSNVDASGKLMVTAKDTAKNVDINIVEKSDTTATATISGANQSTDFNTELASETYANVN